MNCVICRTGETHPGKAVVTFVEGSCTVVVKDVPALVCSTCGEEYVDEDVARQIFSMVDEAAKRGVEVDVRRYEAA